MVLHGTPRSLFARPAALQALGLDVPPAAQVAHGLRAAGLPVPAGAIHPQEVAAAIIRLLTVPEEAHGRAGA